MTAKWIKMPAACELLGCCEKSIYNYIKDGRIRKWQAIPSVGRSRGSKPWVNAQDLRKMLPRQSKSGGK